MKVNMISYQKGLRRIKVTLENDKDNHHIPIRRCTRLSCNTLPAKTTFLYPTAIAKPIC